MNASLQPHVLTVRETVALPLPQKEKLTPLACAAIAGVLRNAQSGNLPLFASTLGLSCFEFQNMAAACLAGLLPDSSRRIPAFFHILAASNLPKHFAPLVKLFMDHRSACHAERQVRWLAHALAAAACGYRPLWQDLDANSPAAVGQLMSIYFPALAERNHRDLGWKRHLFLMLNEAPGTPEHPATGCRECESYHRCFIVAKM